MPKKAGMESWQKKVDKNVWKENSRSDCQRVESNLS